jgi:hypothetical protein
MKLLSRVYKAGFGRFAPDRIYALPGKIETLLRFNCGGFVKGKPAAPAGKQPAINFKLQTSNFKLQTSNFKLQTVNY